MSIFYQALKQFYHYFSKKSIPNSEPVLLSKSTSLSLCADLLDNADVDIKLIKPNLINVNDQIIIDLAEQYAGFLLYTSTRLFKEKLISSIKKEYKNSSNFNDKLFYDNVLAFYNILESEIDKLSGQSKPLIRPTSVFNTPNH